MSIMNSFEKTNIAIINPTEAVSKSKTKLDACIINFSYTIMDILIEDRIIEFIDDEIIKSVTCKFPVYRVKGTNIGVVKTLVGAPATAMLIEEIAAGYSCKNFILFGSCGGLDRTLSPGKLIIPTSAYRDEGLSYHYIEPNDYIDIPGHKKLVAIFDELKIDYIKGKTWTTDAFYRETAKQVEQRKKEGCIVVEMEISACQAVADFRGYNFYPFLYRGDNLDSITWEESYLAGITTDDRLKHFFIALEVTKRILRS